MTGSRGPLSTGHARRRNKPEASERIEVFGRVTVPQVPKTLNPTARAWYRSLRRSGQSAKYEPSDWAAALYCAELMSKLLNARKPSAEMAGIVWRMMTDLLTTEAARRRVRMEIDRRAARALQEEEPADITAYRSKFGDIDEGDEDDEGEGE